MGPRAAAQTFVQKQLLHPWWRLQRSLTLGVQGVVVDGDNRVLLVRHTYRPGWCFPGGGVERRETVAVALARELHEECGVVADAVPELFGAYSNEAHFRGDHVLLYLVRSWHRTHTPAPNSEIAAQGFFPSNDLPPDCAPSTPRRIAEIFYGAPRHDLW